ncbi:hypothetical protein [Frigoriglobus tundricola]|uniref:Uncharacterized protein n=1 Tax=Frigoriglobus tundricola TaxID=2774151 RepID=A0A6M5YR12_9BACT|nr:hypothetical protein [Frigoriglobus tundricola]QJW96507.1 hypothetical protein FTUN_4064 [Frigoriglobus tundricola]
MLNVTRELIDGIRSASSGSSSEHILTGARVAIIARHGGPEDADALLDVFLEAPTDYRRECVLDAVMRVGTRETARKLASECLAKGKLKEGTQAAVLHAIGFLGFAEARDALWAHARGDSDYCEQESGALGLLNLSCDGLEGEIEAAIRACVGKSLFPEFLPVLAHKAGNPELLQTIFDLGHTTASTDCNGGIVYGIALFGEPGRSHFDRLLFDPHWETYGGGTGTEWWAYHGFRHLGGRLARLAQRVRNDHASLPFKEWEYHARVWLELAKCGLGDPLPPIRTDTYDHEQAAEVYGAAFDWTSADADDSLTGLVRDKGRLRKDDVYAFRDRLEARIVSEVSGENSSSPPDH